MKKLLLIILTCCLAYAHDNKDLKIIKIGYIQASKKIDNYTAEFVKKVNELIINENYQVEAFPLPSVRDLYLANKGQSHGALSRSNLVDNSAFPNLKMIKTPIASMRYQLSKKASRDFKNSDNKLRLVCIKDDRLCKGMLGKNYEVIEVTSHKAQTKMLKADRVDLVMRVHIQATGLREELLVPEIDDLELEKFNEPFVASTYTYINEKQFPEVYKVLSKAYKSLSNKKY